MSQKLYGSSLWLPFVVLAVPFIDFPSIGVGAYVKPLAIPVAMLALIFLLIYSGGRLVSMDTFDRRWFALLIWAIIGCLIFPWLIEVPREMKGQELGTRIIRDMLALSAGIMFWLWLRLSIRHHSQIVFVGRWIVISFLPVLPFLVVQIAVVVAPSNLSLTLDSMLSVFRSTSSGISYKKIFGTAPEASMLADQLLTLWLPLAVSSTLLGRSLFRARLLGCKIEAWLLACSLIALIFTQSRIGLIALLFLLIASWSVTLDMRKAEFERRRPLTLLIVLIIIITMVIIGSSRLDQFIGSFSGVDASIEDGVWSNVTRLASWASGLNMIYKYPFGIGTGAFPFLFEQNVPEWGLISPEIQGLIYGDTSYLRATTGSDGGDIESRLPDAKALPIRVITELGIPGFCLLLWIWGSLVKGCWHRFKDCVPGDPLRIVSLAMLLSLITMLPLSFSVNSYIWVHWILIAGLAARIYLPATKRITKGLNKINNDASPIRSKYTQVGSQ
jgi:hypothetical protein